MLNGDAVEGLVDPTDAADQSGLVHAEDLLTEREARTVEHMVVQKNVRGQRILPKLARERDDRDDGAVLVRCVIRDDNDGANTLLNAASGNAGQLRQPDFVLLHTI